jgi:hypothetical protein
MPTGAAPVPASVPGDQTAAAPPTEQPPEQSALGWVGDQLSSFASGAWQGVKSIPEAFTTQPFAPPTGTEAKPPGDFAGATGYGITSSVPMLAGGAGGALLGTAIGGPPGGIAGGALGMFAGTVVQELRPGYVAAVNSGLDHDAAVNQAITQALAQGTFSGLTAPLFAWAPFKGLVGKLLFTSRAADALGGRTRQGRGPGRDHRVYPGRRARSRSGDRRARRTRREAGDHGQGPAAGATREHRASTGGRTGRRASTSTGGWDRASSAVTRA